MKYEKYIDLGFIRTDMNDSVEFKETGYYGFTLTKKINDKMFVSVSGGNLDNPQLYIKKSIGDTYHILKISPEIVCDMFS